VRLIGRCVYGPVRLVGRCVLRAGAFMGRCVLWAGASYRPVRLMGREIRYLSDVIILVQYVII